MERDLAESSANRASQKISTHTLTWSVTIHMTVLCLVYLISTHTLTWSVTIDPESECMYICISTHTLTWSVTSYLKSYFPLLPFQLTRSRGA